MVTLAPAYEDPHMITCHLLPSPGIQEFARQVLWEQWDIAAADASTDEGEIVPDDEEMHRWAQAATAKSRAITGGRGITLAALKGWMADPGRWSPWVDEIALARALQFDWPVIENLTRNERRELIAALVKEGWTPPGPDIQPRRQQDERGHFVGTADASNEGAYANQRDANWRKGTKGQRDRLRKDIYDLKGGAARKVAA